MSNIYIQEPHTNGKVILETSSGDIEIELWSKEAPKACRNFVQLCLEGYYVGTIFHRVVPNFIVQGGDPTGTGTGGESIYGEPFADEFHSRLRFIRRGLVAMANSGVNQNGSQFFFTLDRTDELQNRHTIFGKVVGDTIFNVLKIGEGETDEEERPLYPTTIKATRVVSNPYDDIVPRITIEEKMAMEAAKAAQSKISTKKKAKKNLALLSFGEEAEELEKVPVMKIQSSHDVLDDPRLSKDVSVQDIEEQKVADQKRKKLEETKDHVRQIDEKAKAAGVKTDDEKSKEEEQVSAQDFDRKMRDQVKRSHKNYSSSDDDDSDDEPQKKQAKSSATQSAIDKLRKDIRKIDQSREKIKDQAEQVDKKKKVSLLELERQKYTNSRKAIVGKKGRKGMSEEETLAKLSAFTNKLWSTPVEETKTKEELEKELESHLCVLHSVPHCLSCNDTFGQKEEETDEGWLSHQLVFTKDLKGKDLMQRKDDINDYIVIDPRVRKEQALEEDKRKREQKGGISKVFRSDSRKRERRDDWDSDRYRSRDDRDRRDRGRSDTRRR